MENVTPLWLTVAWRPADVKACLLQTAGLLCYSSSGGVSCFICNRQEVHLPFFFSSSFFLRAVHPIALQRISTEGNYPYTANKALFTREKTTPCAFLRHSQTIGDFLLTRKPHVVHIFIPFSLFVLRTFGFPSVLKEAFHLKRFLLWLCNA